MHVSACVCLHPDQQTDFLYDMYIYFNGVNVHLYACRSTKVHWKCMFVSKYWWF